MLKGQQHQSPQEVKNRPTLLMIGGKSGSTPPANGHAQVTMQPVPVERELLLTAQRVLGQVKESSPASAKLCVFAFQNS